MKYLFYFIGLLSTVFCQLTTESANFTEEDPSVYIDLHPKDSVCQSKDSQRPTEKTLQKLIDLNSTFYGANFIELLDFLIADEGPKVYDLIQNLELDPSETVLAIQTARNKTLERLILDYIHSELGLKPSQQIVFTKLSGLNKEYELDFEFFVNKFSNQMHLIASKFDLSKNNSIVVNFNRLGSNLTETVVHLMRDIFRINLTATDVLNFLDMSFDLSRGVTPGMLVQFEGFLRKNFRKSVNTFLMRRLMGTFKIHVRNSDSKYSQ